MRTICSTAVLAAMALGLPAVSFGAPTIKTIQNNYSYLVTGQPNYGIAPGTLFIVTGAGMAGATQVTGLQRSDVGLPLTLNGASVSVTVNGVTTHPAFYYAENVQLALVLPAATPPGTGTLTVSFNNQSGSAPITVLQSAMGFDTLYGTGTGLAVATPNGSATPYNYNNSASPGETIVLWGSGLGGNSADSDTVFTSTPHAVNVPLSIYIGGLQANILYQGASGYPGVNQIDVTIPAGVQPGCGVSVVGLSGTIVSNTVTIPVHPGGGVCTDSFLGVSGTQLLGLGGKSIYNSGSVSIIEQVVNGVTQGLAEAEFETKQGSDSAGGIGYISLGNCIVNPTVSADANFASTPLDPGKLTVSGFTGGPLTLTQISPGEYAVKFPSGSIPAAGGSFTFSGSGGTTPGTSVGAFSTSLNATAPLVWSNAAAITAVNRTQGQNITWTGGASNSFVIIEGSSDSDNSNQLSVGFICFAPVAPGQFTVPAYILDALPAGLGSLEVGGESGIQPFSAPGLDFGDVLALSGASIDVPFN